MVESNKQLNDANMKLKTDLKRALDELVEVKKENEKLKADANNAKDSQALLVIIKEKEEQYQAHMLELLTRLKAMEEELQ